jgi:hypothetical protein
MAVSLVKRLKNRSNNEEISISSVMAEITFGLLKAIGKFESISAWATQP